MKGRRAEAPHSADLQIRGSCLSQEQRGLLVRRVWILSPLPGLGSRVTARNPMACAMG